MTEIAIDVVLAERAGRIGRTSEVRMPDPLVATTALEHGLDLVTRNRRDFEQIRGLPVRSPTIR